MRLALARRSILFQVKRAALACRHMESVRVEPLQVVLHVGQRPHEDIRLPTDAFPAIGSEKVTLFAGRVLGEIEEGVREVGFFLQRKPHFMNGGRGRTVGPQGVRRLPGSHPMQYLLHAGDERAIRTVAHPDLVERIQDNAIAAIQILCAGRVVVVARRARFAHSKDVKAHNL